MSSRYLPLLVQCRFRHKINIKRPRPEHMERRILRAITEPILPRHLDNPAFNCSVYEAEEKAKHSQTAIKTDLYEKFLIREAKKLFAANQMIVAFQPASLGGNKKREIRNKLLPSELYPMYYSNKAVLQAIADTQWSCLAPLVVSQTMFVLCAEPKVTQLVEITKKIPELFMLGGLVGDYLLTREGLLRYARLDPIESLRGELVSILNASASRTRSLLSSQQQRLSASLQQYATRDSATPERTES